MSAPEGMTVRDVLHRLLDLPRFDNMPAADALLQVTFDGETFFVIEDIWDPYGDGSVVAQLVPWSES